MFIIPSYTIKRNKRFGLLEIWPAAASTDSVKSPCCNDGLVYRNRRNRRVKNAAGETRLFSLRRLACAACGRLHTEIPGMIQPYKHYDTDAIQAALDGGKKAEAVGADDSTVRRWRADFREQEADIELRLESAYARAADAAAPLAASARPIARIKAAHRRWLAFVMALLINAGHKLRTRFAFCPPPVCGTVGTATENDTERRKGNEQTITDSS